MADTRIRVKVKASTDAAIAEALEPKMRSLGNAIAGRMRRLVPKRTYALHDTIQSETKRSGGRVVTTVGAGGGKVKYALHVERGTSRARAQPYMRPALLQSRAHDLNAGG